MYEEAKLLTHSSIKISKERTIYVDPFRISHADHDADFILITHDHFDHFSPDDIAKIAKADTLLLAPNGMEQALAGCCVKRVQTIAPGESIEADGLLVRAIPAYNLGKPFHEKRKNYVGYLVTMDGVRYYIAGDTDLTPESRAVRCEVALVPVGGCYTMDYREAAELVNAIKPALAIPTHYGDVAGSPQDGKDFAALVDPGIEVNVML